MLFEFALLPEVIKEALTSPDLGPQRELIELLRRIRENAMIVDVDDYTWRKEIIRLVTQISCQYYIDMKTLLGELSKHKRIVTHTLGANHAGSDWLTKTNSISCPLDGILAPPALFSQVTNLPSHIHPFPPLPGNSQSTQWYGKRTHTTRKCKSGFRTVLAPVLRHAQRVDLVDPYLDCGSSYYRETLELCVELLSQTHQESASLVIHAKVSEAHGNPIEWKTKWQTYFGGIPVSRPMTFRAFLWRQVPPDRFHNRYVFTDQGVGISIPYGLDCHDANSASQDTWVLMDVDAAQREWAKFTSAPIHKLEAQVEVKR